MPRLFVSAAVFLTFATFGGPVFADGDRVPAVTDATVIKECGACHMAFQPAFLPQRSWRAIMAGLADHFGEDAGLPPDTAKAIEDYLLANASDAGFFGTFRDPAGSGETPLRITELGWWEREHGEEIPAAVWSRPEIGSKANCKACHRGADQGSYEEED